MHSGSATQLIAGIFFSLLSLQAFSRLKPYIDATNDTLASVGQFQITLVFVLALAIFVRTMPEQAGAAGDAFKGPFFNMLTIAIGLMTAVLTLYHLVVDTLSQASEEDADRISQVATRVPRGVVVNLPAGRPD